MQKPLCVDLDGTLLHTDSLHESLLLLCKKNIILLIKSFFILAFQGKYKFKHYVAKHISLDPEYLPYNQELITWLKEQKAKGRKVFLITAAHISIAQSVANFLGFFDGYFGSTNQVNLKGNNKATFLNQQFGENQYDYAGDHKVDLLVWQNAANGIVVNASKKTLQKARCLNKAHIIFPKKQLSFATIFKAIRIHQYVKNILIFVPIILAQKILNIPIVNQSILGFLSFCLLASSVYVLNDLLDLVADRQHHSKSTRAFASGQLSITIGLFLTGTLLLATLALASFLPLSFRMILLVYYLLTISYSFYFKRIVLVDVFFLAALYTIRIVAGITLLSIGYSQWILEFSLFIFLSLAFVKRYVELKQQKKQGKLKTTGRGYHIDHLIPILIFGVSSGYIASLIMALYLSSSQALQFYHQPEFLWLICPLLTYWISRVWLLATEGKVHDDPIVFALKDKVSYFIFILICMSGALAIY